MPKFSCYYSQKSKKKFNLLEDLSLLRGDEDSYPIINEIPRFVDSNNYARDFGLQWNKFSKTQLDSNTGQPISEDRLRRCMRGSLESLEGKTILEAGSGAGRFTEVLLKYSGIVHSFDLSNAVEANMINNGNKDNIEIAQVDILNMPYRECSYDYVICLGVLQHTPSPEKSIENLWKMVKPGGHLIFDHYRFKWRHFLPPPIGIAGPLYRYFILSLEPSTRIKWIRKIVTFWYPIHWIFRKSKFSQRLLRRLSPVHFYYGQIPIHSREELYEWAFLDTHDSLTDFYKHYRSKDQIESIIRSLGCKSFELNISNHGIEAFCTK